MLFASAAGVITEEGTLENHKALVVIILKNYQ